MTGQGVDTRGLRLPDLVKGRQVVLMSTYETIMVCFALVTLLLKLIEAVNGNRHK